MKNYKLLIVGFMFSTMAVSAGLVEKNHLDNKKIITQKDQKWKIK